MDSDLYAKANIKTRSLYDHYVKLVGDYRMAAICAFVEGGQQELVEPIMEQVRNDYEILEQETYATLVPREQLYPTSAPTSPPKEFALDDFAEEGE